MWEVLETEIVPACDTYKFFKRSREGLKQLAQDPSHSCHPPRSSANTIGVETKKVHKSTCAVEDERVFLARKTYCRDDDGTHTWNTREQDKPIVSLTHVVVPLVPEASVKVVDGICLMLTDRRVEYSHSNSVSEYNRHFCVCNTNCGSFFLFVGKTGNTHPRCS
jgi:hypothetical protein